MNALEFIVVIVAITTVGGIITTAIRTGGRRRLGREISDIEERMGAVSGETSAELDRLRKRVSVLERLLTDDDRRLASEIERLRRDDQRV